MDRFIGNITGMFFLAVLLLSPVFAVKSLFNMRLYNVNKLRLFFKSPITYISFVTGCAYIYMCFLMRWHFERVTLNLIMGIGRLYFGLLFTIVIGLIILAQESILAALSLLGGSVFMLVTFVYFGGGI